MPRRDDGTLLSLAVLTAFAVSFVAVTQHVQCTSVGYGIDRAERRQRVLARTLAERQGRVAELRTPTSLLSRARALGLGLEYPAFPSWEVRR